MYNFFVDKDMISGGEVRIGGSDYNHIKNVLRLKIGEQFLVSADGKSALCELCGFDGDCAIANVIQDDYNDTNLPVEIWLFQGLPKADKMELIIQKAVELGASKIVPLEMKRSVVKIEEKKKKQKTERWQAISESSAKQSKRNAVPTVDEPTAFKLGVEKLKECDVVLVPYESKNGMADTLSALKTLERGQKVAIVIGPEGGFDDGEIIALNEIGGKIISLGKRILRTETASITALSMVMLYAEMKL